MVKQREGIGLIGTKTETGEINRLVLRKVDYERKRRAKEGRKDIVEWYTASRSHTTY